MRDPLSANANGDAGAGDTPDPVSPIRQATRILTAQGRLLELIATGSPFRQVLAALVEAVEGQCKGSIASVLLMDEDGRHLRHGSAPRLPAEYNEAIDGVAIGPYVGSCGTAAYRGERVIVADISKDPLWSDYRELAARFGLGACWSQPVFSSSRKVLGTFAVYYPQAREPTDADLDYIEHMAHLASIAIERYQDQRSRRAREKRLLRQKSVLVELANSEALAHSDLKAFARHATCAAAETLGVERVSIWLFNEDRAVLRCEDLYQLSLDRHSRGTELESHNYPRYFAALERGRSVVAHDAHRHEDTREFSEGYLTPLGIGSMLDAPIRRGGRLVGVVCHEHVGPARTWAPEEQGFAASIGDFVSLVIEGSERRKAEQDFRSAQEELLRQQFQARRQVEFELERVKDQLVQRERGDAK